MEINRPVAVKGEAPIAVVIPYRNRASTLPRTLRSLASQSVAPSQVILVDNLSADESAEIVSQWAAEYGVSHPSGEVTLLSEAKPGAAAARNRGLAEVRQPFVMFFDSDDEMLPGHIEQFAAAIAARPDTEIFGRDILLTTLDGRVRRLHCRISDDWLDTMFFQIFTGSLSTQRYVAATALVRRVGGWNEKLQGWNDYELGVRLLMQHPRVWRLDGEPTVMVYSQPDSITGSSFASRPGRWEAALRAVRSEVGADARAGALLTRWVDSRAVILASLYAGEASSVTGARAEAERLLAATLAASDSPRRLKAVYRFQSLFGRLGWLAARILFR